MRNELLLRRSRVDPAPGSGELKLYRYVTWSSTAGRDLAGDGVWGGMAKIFVISRSAVQSRVSAPVFLGSSIAYQAPGFNSRESSTRCPHCVCKIRLMSRFLKIFLARFSGVVKLY